MGNIGPTFIAVLGSIIGLAIVAVVVSKNANTQNVIQSGGTALSQIIGAAVGPVSTASTNQFGSSGGAVGTGAATGTGIA